MAFNAGNLFCLHSLDIIGKNENRKKNQLEEIEARIRINHEIWKIEQYQLNIEEKAGKAEEKIRLINQVLTNEQDLNVELVKFLIEERIMVDQAVDSLKSNLSNARERLMFIKTKMDIEDFKGKIYQIDILPNLILLISGFFLLLIGTYWWNKDEEFNKNILIRQNIDKPTYSKWCQSCGKTFSSTIKYQTEKDNNPNYHFCQNCYINGDFVEKDLTLNELKKVTEAELLNNKNSKYQILKALVRLESLDRWKKNNYL